MTKAGLLKLIRQNCSECMGGPRASENVWPVPNPSDIDACSAPKCAFFVYRRGEDPVKNPIRQKLARERGFGMCKTKQGL